MSTVPGSDDPSGYDLVINATPLGMKPGDAPPVQFDHLASRMWVDDVVTPPMV